MAIEHWLRLALTDGIGPILIRRLIEAAGSVEAASDASDSLLRKVEGVGSSKARAIAESMGNVKVDEELENCRRQGIELICPDDAHYPALLREIPDPPAVLYLKGALEPRDLNAVAIVGSRKCSYYGREQAERFAALLAGVGITVISGGARGVDSSAHRGAMSHPQGRTIAVLGSGIDVPYPPENDSLFHQIAAGRGAIVSEYPLGTPPLRDNFPRRNRIVSGMSRGVLVVEADERSGALITARQACDDHGRTVFAIPGRIDNPLSAGPHKLIRDGAVLTETITDILDNLGPLPHSAQEALASQPVTEAACAIAEELHPPGPPPDIGLTERQRLILSHLGDPLHVDGLVERTELAVQDVLLELTILSLKGAVKRVEGQTYVRGKTVRS